MFYINKKKPMLIQSFVEKMHLKSKRDVLRLHIYLKMLEFGIKPFFNDIDIIIELYLFGGYKDAKGQTDFIDLCLEKKLKKSAQSLRNTLSEYVILGVFEKPKNSMLNISTKYLSEKPADQVILQYTISHAV